MRAVRNSSKIAVTIALFAALAFPLVAPTGVLAAGQPQEATADHLKAPPSFEIDGGAEAVFVDFERASYDITFDYGESRAGVVSTIDFYQPAAGNAVFDLVPDTIEQVTLDDATVNVITVQDPDRETRFRALSTRSEAGNHRLVIRSGFDRNVHRRDGGIVAGLWVNDWDNRAFLELYLPSNLEFDGYQMTFDVAIEGTSLRHPRRATTTREPMSSIPCIARSRSPSTGRRSAIPPSTR